MGCLLELLRTGVDITRPVSQDSINTVHSKDSLSKSTSDHSKTTDELVTDSTRTKIGDKHSQVNGQSDSISHIHQSSASKELTNGIVEEDDGPEVYITHI